MSKLTLVLLPGMDGTGALFAPLIAALKGEFAVRVVSYPVDGARGYAELDAIAQRFLPMDEPYVILGESFSGPIAVSLAARATPNLTALVLCCTFVHNPRPALSMMRGLLGVLPVSIAPVTALSHLLLGKFSTNELRQCLANSLRQVSPAALRARLAAVLSVDVSEKLAKVQVPILYLRAKHDRLVPSSASALIANVNPKTQVVEIDAPHFLLQTVPIEAAKIIIQFVKDVK
jgi:pimeloyl-[acyl-carrier protein] methyl ester esterase